MHSTNWTSGYAVTGARQCGTLLPLQQTLSGKPSPPLPFIMASWHQSSSLLLAIYSVDYIAWNEYQYSSRTSWTPGVLHGVDGQGVYYRCNHSDTDLAVSGRGRAEEFTRNLRELAAAATPYIIAPKPVKNAVNVTSGGGRQGAGFVATKSKKKSRR